MALSRTKAAGLILAGQVKVNGLIITKVGTLIETGSLIEIIRPQAYVSRGGEKLEGALLDLNIDPAGLVCLDVGASTGGFTDCLLQKGAVRVYAVDVGHGQIMDSLKADPRVVNMEQTHIRDVRPEQLRPQPELAVIDVSFISLKNVLPKVKMLLPSGAKILAMVKPQFEVGAKFLKKGVVRDEAIQKAAVQDIIDFAGKEGLTYLGQSPSKLKGPKGNQEYFVFLINKI